MKKKVAKKNVCAPAVAAALADDSAMRKTSGGGFLGADYPYYKYIKNPKEMGMSTKGDTATLGKDVNGIIEYVNLLTSGTSKASKTGKPLGNKYFLNTSATCIAVGTKTEVERFIYVNNVPTGNIPLLSSSVGNTGAKGLLPGMVSNLNVLNPFDLANAFNVEITPPCIPVTLQTINNNNVVGSETNYIATMDVENMDPCVFSNKQNPVTKKKCVESFMSNTQMLEPASIMIPDDPLVKLYYVGLSALGVYILYRLMDKPK
jgi:hypothetical protein